MNEKEFAEWLNETEKRPPGVEDLMFPGIVLREIDKAVKEFDVERMKALIRTQTDEDLFEVLKHETEAGQVKKKPETLNDSNSKTFH